MSRLSIEIPKELHRRLKAQASLHGVSMREYVLRRLTSSHSPAGDHPRQRFSQSGLAGIWSDREDMKDPEAWLRDQRKPRVFSGPEGVD